MILKEIKRNIQFSLHELAGSFGDLGTSFPLVVSLIVVCGLDPASSLIMFGLMQIFTGLIYGIPMPVQPLKAMAVIALTQKISPNVLYAGGFTIGLMMLVLTLTGTLSWLSNIVPKTVVRGVQFGLGLQLALLAFKEYLPAEGAVGWSLAAFSFILIVLFLHHRRYPAALLVIALGLIYASIFKLNITHTMASLGFSLPRYQSQFLENLMTGFLLLAIPQIFLSIGNSILATQQVVSDFFPQHRLNVKKLGLTYALMNLVVPFFGGIPVCHGSGGIAGHYAFGGRTGATVIFAGSLYLILGLFFSQAFKEVIQLFPKPILGVILIFEGLSLLKLTQDTSNNKSDFGLAILVGLLAVGLPYGYVVGLTIGTILFYLKERKVVRL